MSYDNPTIPIQGSSDHPTWPTSRPGRPFRPQRSRARSGCGLGLALTGAFVVGVILSALVFAPRSAPDPRPSTPASQTGGALKVTVTDTFLNDALNASGGGSLSNIQTHIQSNGQLTISGILQGSLIGSGQPAVVVLAPSVSQGKLIVTPVSGAVAGFPLPGLALNSIASAVNQQLTKASDISVGGGQRLTAQSVSFATGEMTITYA